MIINFDEISKRIKNRLEKLYDFSSTDTGLTIMPFSPNARQVAGYIKDLMKQDNIKSHEDAAGSVIGEIEDSISDYPAVLMGSHYDTVRNGGIFDGLAGIICAIEVARLVKQNEIKLKHPLEIIATNDEEGLRFTSGFFGIKAVFGEIDDNYLSSLKDENGISIGNAMLDYGLDPEKILLAKRNPENIRAFIEIHIEQGPILENNGIEIGIVEGIVGMQRFLIKVKGRADHAGTTPMNMRSDAMSAASKLIAKISDWAELEQNNSVATVGFIKGYPNSVNIIPELIKFSVDIRSINLSSIKFIVNRIKQFSAELEVKYKVSFEIENTLNSLPSKMSTDLVKMVELECNKAGYSNQRIISGAGHDSLIASKYVPTSMIFVPSKGGRSHCPEEFSDYNQLAKAVGIAFRTVLKINEMEYDL
jgi:allantoate deiminase